MIVGSSRAAVTVPLAATLVLAAGCGGDDAAGGDQGKIATVATAVVTAADGAAVCRTHLTADFVRAVFGDGTTCVRSGTDEDPADNATGAAVTDVRVEGDTATATVAEQGGASDGASGTWAFARGPDGWRVAEWRIDYLRSGFAIQLGPGYRVDGPDDPLADADARACVSEKLQALADPEFQATAFALFRESPVARAAVQSWYYDCVSRSGGDGISGLRRIFEDGLRQAGVPAAIVECAVRTLRTTVRDAQIRRMGESGAAQPPPAVQKQIEEATVECVEKAGAR